MYQPVDLKYFDNHQYQHLYHNFRLINQLLFKLFAIKRKIANQYFKFGLVQNKEFDCLRQYFFGYRNTKKYIA